MTTAYTFVSSPNHVYPDHPERPARLDILEPRLKSFDAELIETKPATYQEIEYVHDPKLVATLEKVCLEEAPGIIDYAPTYVTQSSFEDALLAAGGVIACARAVLNGDANNAFAIVRPPGHHAEPERAMGFCLFNNVAIGVAHALARGLERAAVLDFDVHHGNGTEQIFAAEPRVVMVGTFEYPLYPYSGVDPAGPNMHNVPLRAGSDGKAFRAAMTDVCLPALEEHRPEILFISAGFDAHRDDPLANLQLLEADYTWITQELVAVAERHAQGRIVSSLEGGYALPALGRSAVTHIRALAQL